MQQLSLSTYIRLRCRALGLNVSELCRNAGISRQTLYSLEQTPGKLPEISTVLSLASSLRVHPMQLLQLAFQAVPIPASAPQQPQYRQDCSAFVRDVTYPDGSMVTTGQRFTKTWELQNVGNVPWEGRYLQCEDPPVPAYEQNGQILPIGQRLTPITTRVPVPFTAPSELVQISVDFIAPSTPATIISYWKSYFPDGQLCFPQNTGLWVQVQVISLTVATSSGF